MAEVIGERAGGRLRAWTSRARESSKPVHWCYGIHRLLSRRTLIVVSVVAAGFFFLIWAAWLLMIASGSPEADSQPRVDFLAYWSASSLALDGQAIAAYDQEAMKDVQEDLLGERKAFPWLYPPTFFLFILPLAALPVVPSLVAWFAATGALALSAVRRISRDRLVLVLAIAFPATFWNFVTGQNGLLTAGLLAWGVLLLRDRPVIAGVLFGLLVYKPHFFPLVLLALLASRERSAALSAVATVAAISVASLAMFGLEAWREFISVASSTGNQIYEGTVAPEKMQSVSGALVLLNLEPIAVQVLQAAAAVASAGLVVWLWRKDVALEYKAAGLALAMLLATPYSYHYDLTLLGLAVLWLGVRFQKEGWRAWDAEVLALAWLTPVAGLLAGRFLGFSLGAFVILLMLVVLMSRSRANEAGPSRYSDPERPEQASRASAR